DGRQRGRAVDDAVDGPLRAAAEERGYGYLQHVVVFPHDDRDLDAIAVAERLPRRLRVREVDDHVDALLLDPERRNLREAERLDVPHAAVQRLGAAAPVLDDDARAGLDAHGVRRQELGHDLEVARVADRKNFRTARDDAR